MTQQYHAAQEKLDTRSFWLKNKFLILRRISQLGFLSLFLAGPLAGLWIVEGNMNSSLTLGMLPLTDPYILLQSLIAGQLAAGTAFLGAFIVVLGYGLLGGRTYCSWVCPINIFTDLANYLHKKLDINKGWTPKIAPRSALLVMTLFLSALTGTVAWEWINPVSMLYRGLIFGLGYAWVLVVAIVLFDIFVARHGWCGKLCPVGAFYGLIGKGSLLRISAQKRDACDDCMKCFDVCPEMHVITPALRGAKDGRSPVILSGDCTNCGRCIDVCSEDVYRFTHRFNHTEHHTKMPENASDAV